jgi:hypothetical protein
MPSRDLQDVEAVAQCNVALCVWDNISFALAACFFDLAKGIRPWAFRDDLDD